MIKKIYIKLYFYAFIVLLTSIILTTLFLSISMEFKHNNIRPYSLLLKEAEFIRTDLNQTYNKNPVNFKMRLFELSHSLSWDIAYCKNSTLQYYAGTDPVEMPPERELNSLPQKYTITLSQIPLTILMYLDENNLKKGFLILRHTTLPVFLMVSLLFFLAILLIPYSLYVLKPFKTLMDSIEKISQGDLSHSIEVKENNEFKPLVDAFNNMRLKIQEMIDEKQRLIADVSHELRSPLTRMRLSLEVLSKDPEARKGYIPQVISEIEELDFLIGDLLELSKLELDDSKVKIENIDLVNLIEQQIEKHMLLFNKHELTIKLDLSHEPIYMKSDFHLMERVFNNFFSNILKYAPAKSVVDISLKKTDNQIRLAIRDRGQGISPDEYEKIFEPFYRTDKSRSRKTGGTGLGLAITKKIVELHGGKIMVTTPEDDQGGVAFNIDFFIK